MIIVPTINRNRGIIFEPLIYKDGDKLTVYSEYTDLINGLLLHGKKTLVKKVFKTMNEHFAKLRNSDREEERKFYPGKTAEEIFLGYDEDEQKKREAKRRKTKMLRNKKLVKRYPWTA